jgi:hypothetical protein
MPPGLFDSVASDGSEGKSAALARTAPQGAGAPGQGSEADRIAAVATAVVPLQ